MIELTARLEVARIEIMTRRSLVATLANDRLHDWNDRFAASPGLLISDAHEGRAPYGWALLTDAVHRRYLLRDGWKGLSRVFVLAYVLDLVYQQIVLGQFRALQALSTAILLALIPYLLLRGPANRLTPDR